MHKLLRIIGPGLLVAATGVGAGDLATASFTGSQLGTAVLWAVALGALLKFVLTEGLARYQLATGETLLEGVVARIGKVAGWLFLPYLLLWSLFVGSAMMSACGATLHALVPAFREAARGKLIFGIGASLLGLALVWTGGYRLVEKVMSACVVVMVVTVVFTALLLAPDPASIARGLFVPVIPDAGGEGTAWTAALIGGVGGTLTVLCYGYWIREAGRAGSALVPTCRIDLGVGYAVTALFGVCMVIVGSNVHLEGGGADLLVRLSARLDELLGPLGRWAFLIGATGAVFSSLLGVWQAVPYLFADLWRLLLAPAGASRAGDVVDTRARPYRLYLVGIATLPAVGLLVSFKEVQKAYAVVGAAFMPLLALALLVLGSRSRWMGTMRNRWPGLLGLMATLAFFALLAWRQWTS